MRCKSNTILHKRQIFSELFSTKAEHVLDNYSADQKTMKGYFIFTAIACFPLGLLSILAYYFLYGNNVKVDNFNYVKITTVEKEEKEPEVKPESENIPEEKSEESASEETEAEKLEKLEKLKNFKEKGIISDEEFEMAREQMFGNTDEQK